MVQTRRASAKRTHDGAQAPPDDPPPLTQQLEPSMLLSDEPHAFAAALHQFCLPQHGQQLEQNARLSAKCLFDEQARVAAASALRSRGKLAEADALLARDDALQGTMVEFERAHGARIGAPLGTALGISASQVTSFFLAHSLSFDSASSLAKGGFL